MVITNTNIKIKLALAYLELELEYQNCWNTIICYQSVGMHSNYQDYFYFTGRKQTAANVEFRLSLRKGISLDIRQTDNDTH